MGSSESFGFAWGDLGVPRGRRVQSGSRGFIREGLGVVRRRGFNRARLGVCVESLARS